MSPIQKSTKIALTILALLCLVWLIYRNANFLVSGLGIIEFRETDLIAMCLLSFTLMRAQWKRRPLVVANAIAFSVAGFTIFTKGVIMFFSEDRWIAGWHATNFAAGCCLLILTLESLERANQLKPNKAAMDKPDPASS